MMLGCVIQVLYLSSMVRRCAACHLILMPGEVTLTVCTSRGILMQRLVSICVRHGASRCIPHLVLFSREGLFTWMAKER
ncbi:hypothetical protein MT325_m768L [Paramecium bursaria chlorella virus MT325]|uniref:Uncharacterized protein m768L n=1 Tax=Paramecium bursaria Chlorella virus MT325 TaxID=346932 RepID=A7IVE8_PBCVM|nr:hypothetical protein MT325_m768L [Paramecium bursaria chlorella virus MT325]